MSGPHAESGHEPEPVDYGEQVARAAHAFYERFAKVHRWKTQEATRDKAFDDLPPENRATMLATFRGLLDAGVILPGPAVTGRIEKAS
jgi:hypothetical protein